MKSNEFFDPHTFAPNMRPDIIPHFHAPLQSQSSSRATAQSMGLQRFNGSKRVTFLANPTEALGLLDFNDRYTAACACIRFLMMRKVCIMDL